MTRWRHLSGRAIGLARRLGGDRRAATAIEYGLIIALVVLAMMLALTTLADVVVAMWGHVNTEVEAVV